MDRPALETEDDDEIGISPEMAEAGASILAGYDNFFESDDRVWAKKIYAAMEAKKENLLESL